MNKIVNKTFLKGSLDVITSKSVAHRVMICAAAADKKTSVFGLNNSADTEATRRCLTGLGAEFRDMPDGSCEITPIFQGGGNGGGIRNLRADFLTARDGFPISDLRIKDGTSSADADSHRGVKVLDGGESGLALRLGDACSPRGGVKILDCGESGSTLRFLLPFAAALGFDAEFHMSGRLPERPTDELLGVMEKNGVKISKNGKILRTSGRLQNGIFELGGKISSQFTSGLLMSLPLVRGESFIKDGDAPESAGYVDITLGVLKKFIKNPPYRRAEMGGFTVNCRDSEYCATGSSSAVNGASLEYYARENIAKAFGGGSEFVEYSSPGSITIEGDWSNAAFFVVAGALNGDIVLKGLDPESKQPDREIVAVIRRMGGNITATEDGGIRVVKSALKGVEIDAKNIPDIIPVISVAAGAAAGRTTVYNAGRLRIKECDRLEATAEMLNRLGASAVIDGDTLTIDGSGGFERAERNKGIRADGRNAKKIILEGYGDHRMVMSAAVAAFACGVPVEITGVEAADKSYPDFFEDLKKLTATRSV